MTSHRLTASAFKALWRGALRFGLRSAVYAGIAALVAVGICIYRDGTSPSDIATALGYVGGFTAAIGAAGFFGTGNRHSANGQMSFMLAGQHGIRGDAADTAEGARFTLLCFAAGVYLMVISALFFEVTT